MLTAVISDVHANAAALRAALADAADLRAERIVCLGDVAGYGPEPAEALALVHRAAHVCLAGNHDDAVAGRFPAEDFTDAAAAAVARHAKELSREAVEWLRRLPHVCSFGEGEKSFACAHADFAKPEEFGYVTDAAAAAECFAARAERVLFIGHTHRPAVWELRDGKVSERPAESFRLEDGVRYLVNAGSAGYPRSGACRSTYCAYDDEKGVVAFRSLPFDIEGYAAKMRAKGVEAPGWMRFAEEARKSPAVRAGAEFAVKAPAKGKKKARPAEKPERAWPFYAAAGVVAAAFAACAAAVAWKMAPEVVEIRDAKVEAAAAEEEPAEEAQKPGPAPAEAAALEVVAAERCTVPPGAKVGFSVKLKKGSAPAWVRLRYEDANGEATGDGMWFHGVKSSRRRRNLKPPADATAAFLEVLRAHDGDACGVETMAVGPEKEKRK